MIEDNLLELGLKAEEAKVYISLLELGSSYASVIAKKSGVNRVACYHTLDNLVKKGLVSSFLKNNIKIFSIETPEILVKKQKEKYEKAKNLLPQLLSITNSLTYKPKIQYYEGEQGIKNIFEDTLLSETELLGYTNLKDISNVISPDYLRNYIKRKLDKKLKTRMLSPRSKEALEYRSNYYPKNFDHNLLEIFFVNADQYSFSYEVTIYGNKTSLVSLNPKELIGIIIESSLYAETQRSAFNLSWLGATTFVAK